MKMLLVLIAIVAQAPVRVPSPLIGTWTLDGFRGGAPLGLRHERAICGALLMGGAANSPDGSNNPEQISSMGTVDGTVTLSLSAAGLLIERTFTGSAGTGSLKHTYPLDGSSSPASGSPAASGKISVAGAALHVETTLTRGKEAAAASCTANEVFEIDGAGMLRITATAGTGSGRSVQTFVRQPGSQLSDREKLR